MAYRIEERLSFEVNGDRNLKQTALMNFMFRYFSINGVLLMVFVTVTLLLLPLVLPPLPPPPLMLLFVPVAIMAVLVFLAVTPPKLPNVAFNSV
ncbi:hypothetical protein ACS0TY_025305 [Phlomoides rotata]